MNKLKKLCSSMLCVVMVTVFTITPIYATEAATIPATISGNAERTNTAAKFESDWEFNATLSSTTPASNANLKATVKYTSGTTTSSIATEEVTVQTSNSSTVSVPFKFTKEKLNQLPAGSYDIEAESVTGSSVTVTKAKIGTINIKGAPAVTIDKPVALTKSRSNFETTDGKIKAKLDKAFFASTNAAALELTASINDNNNNPKLSTKASANKNGEVTFTFTQAELNTLPEGDFTITVTSEGNTLNDAIAATSLGTIKITPIKNATVVTPQTFDLSKQDDVVIGIVNNGRTLTSIKNGSSTLTNGKDYTIEDGTVRINKSYLSTFAVGKQYLTFHFDGGNPPICEIDIIKSSKNTNLILKGYNNQSITTLSNRTAGSKLPGWNKSSYKKAGRKGYQFIGWTYNGKTVTTVPSDRLNVTLTAKFSKLSVGRASASSVKGKSGKGVGFVATSKAYTKADGSRRGFRFRYSRSSSMKKATYKTTGLAKNVYTKTGLTKRARYYVQVRYYYYDSTNQKVYGAYSKSSSVKAY